MKYKIAAFFAGRNGYDALAKTVLWASVIMMLLSSFISIAWLSSVFYAVSVAGLIYSWYRMFSKDLDKRQKENQVFLTWQNQRKLRWKQRKTHRFYRCPQCKTVLRVPKGKGKINIGCKTCGNHFVKKT